MKYNNTNILVFLSLFFASCNDVLTEKSNFPMTLIYNGNTTTVNCYSEMLNGKRSGECRCFNDSGALILKEYYSNNVKHGQQTYFYETGTVKVTRNIEEGITQGKSYEYYPNGKKKLFRYFDKGEIIYEKEYDKQGNITITGLTLDIEDKQIGNEIEFLIELKYTMSFRWRNDKEICFFEIPISLHTSSK